MKLIVQLLSKKFIEIKLENRMLNLKLKMNTRKRHARVPN
jgi:hypothetical protein